MGASLALMHFAPSVATVVVVVIALYAGNGLVSPSLSSLLSRASSSDQQGGVLGINQSAWPLVAGWMFDASYALPFVVGGLLVLLAAALILARVSGSVVSQNVESAFLPDRPSAVATAAASGEVR